MGSICKICGQKIYDSQKDTAFSDFNMCKYCAKKYKEFIAIKNMHNQDIKA